MTLGEAYDNVRDCVSAVGTDEDKEAIIVIRKALAEALKPSHNIAMPKLPKCPLEKCRKFGGVNECIDCIRDENKKDLFEPL